MSRWWKSALSRRHRWRIPCVIGLVVVALTGLPTNAATRPVLLGTISGVSPGATDFDPRGGILATNDATVNQTVFWNIADPADATPVSRLATATDDGNFGAFSPDGQHFFVVGGLNDWLAVYNVSDITQPFQAGGTGMRSNRSGGLSVSPNGRIVAGKPFGGAGGGYLVLWDVIDPANPAQLSITTFEGGLRVSRKAFGHDGRILAISHSTGGCPQCSVELQFYIVLLDVSDPANPTRVTTIKVRGSSPLAFSPDGRTLAAGGTSMPAALWDVSTPTAPRESALPLAGSLTAVAFSPDGRLLATGDAAGMVVLWDVSGAAPRRLRVLTRHPMFIGSLAFSPDGQVLAVQAGDIELWKLA